MTETFTPGALVRVRNREWVIQPNADPEVLRLRPLGGSDEDIQLIIPQLENPPVEPATFPDPKPDLPGSYDSALLLRDALRLKMRSGAGPFRCFGHIAVEPRPYQLVPLLMALKQETVRLLIADDVGVGKTIEAALIVRELYDRGDIQRFSVLCPPHLVEQWVDELNTNFHIPAVAVTGKTIDRLEREVNGISVFEHFTATVVSLDFIKSDRHRDHFLAVKPDLVVVDEAHTCTLTGQGRQLRFQLLQKLSEKADLHLLLLTATPHSGDEVGFHNLLSLLKPQFAQLGQGLSGADDPLRQELAQYFVQRRRKDIEEWSDVHLFPKRMTKEVTYTQSGEWGKFFEAVRAYCVSLASRTEQEKGEKARMIWYATLALLRCVSSSSAAAHRALTTRLNGSLEEQAALAEDRRVDDGEGQDLVSSDQEPAGSVEDTEMVRSLIAQAEALKLSKGDPKLIALEKHLTELIGAGYRPVVFCRYIATANYVAEHLKQKFSKLSIDAITGEFTPEEREDKILELTKALANGGHPLLVATDCLSEGINLQQTFNAVVHYDLAWNPTRHEQREGRVDRFGQISKEVRCTLMYGQDNPIDGFVLDVILRKAKVIQEELGVLVPLPEDDKRVRLALVKAALMRSSRTSPQQSTFDFDDGASELVAIESQWKDAREKAKVNRTIFRQARLKPEEVMPEWTKQRESLGTPEEVERFVSMALTRLGAPLNEKKQVTPQFFPPSLKDRLSVEGYSQAFAVDFHYPPPAGTLFIHRSHPLVALLADFWLEGTLAGSSGIGRCGVFETKAVSKVTTLFIVRLRHQIEITSVAGRRTLMAEESLAWAIEGRQEPKWLEGTQVEKLLDIHPSGNLGAEVQRYQVTEAIEWFHKNREVFDEKARNQAQTLLSDHRRVRDASQGRGQYSVEPKLPVDLMAVFVLLPDTL